MKHFDYSYALETFNINLFSCCEIMAALLKKPNQNHLKNVILISSISAKIGYKGTSVYAASKAGLDSLSRSLSHELSPQVRINSIILGNIQTRATQHLQDTLLAPPLGVGKPQDVSYLVEFLLSARSGWITGQNIVLDGGKTSVGY
ncbi:SDR family oxidoreductase [Helicobacter sp. 11S03491-1]|uniref:SDR family NAD(P)-dependent oxidoreductase n=1 Tax=Helicobacter sp. 11S03491-1 TaxID=1476196 RepID=UPI002151ED6C|nr:SDR family oxidoreductase [Helicobacter sp. 11S03491-1]